jgi:hypothetical protein
MILDKIFYIPLTIGWLDSRKQENKKLPEDFEITTGKRCFLIDQSDRTYSFLSDSYDLFNLNVYQPGKIPGIN